MPAPAPDWNPVSRRDWLRLGGLGAFGLTLPDWLGTKAAAAGRPNRPPRACIFLFFLGGPPQHETWDPKPDAPVEVRGDLRPIPSATPGLWVGELMPRTARLTNKIAVLRAVQTGDPAHSSSGYYMTTGVPHAPPGVENAKPGAPNDWPSLGAMVRKVWPRPTLLPAAVTLPEESANDGNLTWPGQDGGFLGRSADPWLVACDPAATGFAVPGLGLPADVPAQRLADRRGLLGVMDHRPGGRAARDGHADRVRQALDLITSPAARRAFDLEAEDPRTRDRYGRHRFGQSVLLARRLVEAGVPLVRVNWTRVPGAPNNGHWDTHTKNTEGLKRLMPLMDEAYSALLDDLADRGLLDDTLVVWAGEFGRTPRINPAGGRDHWGNAFSVALAGGGVRGGVIYGATDRIGADPKDGRVRPQDLTATVFHCLGIPPTTEVIDHVGRPLPVSRGEVIRAVF